MLFSIAFDTALLLFSSLTVLSQPSYRRFPQTENRLRALRKSDKRKSARKFWRFSRAAKSIALMYRGFSATTNFVLLTATARAGIVSADFGRITFYCCDTRLA